MKQFLAQKSLTGKYLVVLLSAWCFLATTVVGQEVERSTGPVEEVVVQGQRFVIDSTVAFERLTEANGRGARLYKQGKYAEALPFLLVGARVGFKMSQARVGAIYLHGLGSVEKDVTKGIGWMGVASEPTTAPTIRRTWKQILSSVREDQIPLVEQIVAAYIAKYGSGATGTNCEMKSNTKSFISRLDCSLTDELFKYASHEQKAMIACVTGDPTNCMGVGGFEHYVGAHMESISAGGGAPSF